MKTALLALLVTTSFITSANAKSFFGSVDKYIIKRTGQIIEVGSNEIADGVAKYYDYKDSKRKNIALTELSKNTSKEIAGVMAGERILLTTRVANSNTAETISRYCEVFHLFENKMAYVGCKTYEADNKNGQLEDNRIDFIVGNVENVIAEVNTLGEFSTNDKAEMAVSTENTDAGRNVRILAIFSNGEALVQKTGINFIDTSMIIYKHGVVDRVLLTDLRKL